MNSLVARELLSEELARLGALSYAEAKALIGREPRTREVVARDNVMYQFEVQTFWDAKEEGDIRIICSVDDGGVCSLAPITDGIIIRKKA